MAVKKSTQEQLSTLFGLVVVNNVQEETKDPAVTIWDFVNSISENKNYLYDDDSAKAYTPFTMNRAFSIHLDTLYHASLMNRYYNLDKKMQHDYYFYTLPKKVRRKKWLKKTDDEKEEAKILEDVSKVINYNFIKTKSFWKTLSENQRKEFLARYVYPDSKNEKQNAKNHK
jgi:hypothetical protein